MALKRTAPEMATIQEKITGKLCPFISSLPMNAPGSIISSRILKKLRLPSKGNDTKYHKPIKPNMVRVRKAT
jgi:hypothetical protein